MIGVALVIATIYIMIYINSKSQRTKLMEQINQYGGMKNKHKFIIDELLQNPDSIIVKEGWNLICIRTGGIRSSTNLIIKEKINEVEITWNFEVELNIMLEKKWTFPHDHNPIEILDTINEDIEVLVNDF